MWKWILGLGGLGAIAAIAVTSSKAATAALPQQSPLLTAQQFQALFKVALQNDLTSGGAQLPSNVTVDGLAATYAQIYLAGTKEQVAVAIADANARKYSQTAGILAQRPR